jgi:hypothetical protein
MLEGDSFAIDSVLHLLSELTQPVLPQSQFGFLQFLINIEISSKVESVNNKLTKRESEKEDKTAENLFISEVFQQ